MCTTDQTAEIIAEILTAHLGMPRGYAAWFVAQLTPTERSFTTHAAIQGRKSLVREVQRDVHRRRAEFIPLERRDRPERNKFRSTTKRRRRRKMTGQQHLWQ